MNRRELIKNAAGIALGLTVAGTLADKALATRAWSHKDPVVVIDGHYCQVDVAAWAEAPLHDFANFCTGAVDLSVHVPVGVTTAQNIATGDNAWGYGYSIHFVPDSTLHTGSDSLGSYSQIQVYATVPANLDTDGHEWRMQLTLTPSDPNRSGDQILFRSNSQSNAATCRV